MSRAESHDQLLRLRAAAGADEPLTLAPEHVEALDALLCEHAAITRTFSRPVFDGSTWIVRA